MKTLDWKQTVLGIELGSTRIKAVLLDENHIPVASGSHEWENEWKDGIWTYSMESVENGLRQCYAALKRDVREKFGRTLTRVGALGISGMMHGYLPLDAQGVPLTAFRTWRNTITGEAAELLTERFAFNIPQRWSIAHLYRAMRGGEAHVRQIDCLTTLAGYIHWRLSGEKIVGIGEASGIFPVDADTLDYRADLIEQFDALAAEADLPWRLRDILPRVLPAGVCAGRLTEAGARFLDPTGELESGIPLAPCEGDAGTGMTATNSVRPMTGNVSAGTSAFAMVVTEQPMGVHREIDMVATPTGKPVAMVHCNNCTSDINAWVGLFGQFAEALGTPAEKGELYTLLFQKALEGEPDCGGMVAFNYYSGEGVTDLDAGKPLLLRQPDSRLTLANFMRLHLSSALATLKLGMDILTVTEGVKIEKLYGHGGFFKTPEVGQRLLSAAVGVPVAVMQTAGEGGPYGMALLCAYLLRHEDGETLEDYLEHKVFVHAQSVTRMAEPEEIAGFARFLAAYRAALPIERAAAELK